MFLEVLFMLEPFPWHFLSESYGEDIAESDTSDTYSYGSEDEYESDFIDDADVAMYTDSHGPKSSGNFDILCPSNWYNVISDNAIFNKREA